MGYSKSRRAQAKPVGPYQAMIDREANEESSAPLVSAYAEQHGDYEKNLRFVRNRGGTAVDRWTKAGALSDSQLAGILHCQTLWAKLGSQSVVIDFERVRGLPHGEGYSQHEALAEIHRIKSAYPLAYWDVFERVCRFDEPAGTAGSRLSNIKRSAEIAARTIVCFIADMIATRERLSY
jgi:hypothetical protein